jgi:hypothetical protein
MKTKHKEEEKEEKVDAGGGGGGIGGGGGGGRGMSQGCGGYLRATDRNRLMLLDGAMIHSNHIHIKIKLYAYLIVTHVVLRIMHSNMLIK